MYTERERERERGENSSVGSVSSLYGNQLNYDTLNNVLSYGNQSYENNFIRDKQRPHELL